MSITNNIWNILNDSIKSGHKLSKMNTSKRMDEFKKLNDDQKAYSNCQDLKSEDYKIISKILNETKTEKDLSNESPALIAKTLTAQKRYFNRLLENIEVYSEEGVKINNKIQIHLQIINKLQPKAKKYEGLVKQNKEEAEIIKNNITLLERKLECSKGTFSDQNTPAAETLKHSPIIDNLKERRSNPGLKDVKQQIMVLKNTRHNEIKQKSFKKRLQKTPFSEIAGDTISNRKKLSCVDAINTDSFVTSTINSGGLIQKENNFRCSKKKNKNKVLKNVNQTPTYRERATNSNSNELYLGNKVSCIGKVTENVHNSSSSVIKNNKNTKNISSNKAVEIDFTIMLSDTSVSDALDKNICDNSVTENLDLRNSKTFVT